MIDFSRLAISETFKPEYTWVKLYQKPINTTIHNSLYPPLVGNFTSKGSDRPGRSKDVQGTANTVKWWQAALGQYGFRGFQAIRVSARSHSRFVLPRSVLTTPFDCYAVPFFLTTHKRFSHDVAAEIELTYIKDEASTSNTGLKPYQNVIFLKAFLSAINLAVSCAPFVTQTANPKVKMECGDKADIKKNGLLFGQITEAYMCNSRKAIRYFIIEYYRIAIEILVCWAILPNDVEVMRHMSQQVIYNLCGRCFNVFWTLGEGEREGQRMRSWAHSAEIHLDTEFIQDTVPIPQYLKQNLRPNAFIDSGLVDSLHNLVGMGATLVCWPGRETISDINFQHYYLQTLDYFGASEAVFVVGRFDSESEWPIRTTQGHLLKPSSNENDTYTLLNTPTPPYQDADWLKLLDKKQVILRPPFRHNEDLKIFEIRYFQTKRRGWDVPRVGTVRTGNIDYIKRKQINMHDNDCWMRTYDTEWSKTMSVISRIGDKIRQQSTDLQTLIEKQNPGAIVQEERVHKRDVKREAKGGAIQKRKLNLVPKTSRINGWQGLEILYGDQKSNQRNDPNLDELE